MGDHRLITHFSVHSPPPLQSLIISMFIIITIIIVVIVSIETFRFEDDFEYEI